MMVVLQDYINLLYNVTNKTLSRHVRHDNFVTDIKNPACEMVQLMPYSQRCQYAIDTDECHEDLFLVDYSILYYCTIAPEKTYAVVLSIILLFSLCLVLFVILGSASDGFFCPSLKVLSKIMGLSENLAGVTLLAFGNAAPDLFTSIAGMQAEAREAFNDVMGGVCFVNLLVTSAIILAKPFKLTPSSFLRDILFMLLDIIFLDYAIKSGNVVTLAEAIIIFMMYVAYIVVICVDQYLLVRATKNLRLKSMSHGQLEDAHKLKSLQSEAQIDILSRVSHRPTVIFETGYQAKRMSTSNAGLFRQFFDTINVIDMDDWRQGNFFSRALQILFFPINFILTIVLPIVDYEVELNGWSKLLNTLQVMYLPPLILYGFTRETGIPILGIPLAAWLFVITVPLGIVIFIFSRTDRAPAFHKYMSILGVFGSVFVVYGCASELIQILKVLGYITHRSNSFLGCTLLAWGNSVGDLIANTAMARHGYQKMGFAACYGGPLFNSLLTVGMIFIYRAASHPDLQFKTGEGTLGETSAIFLIIGISLFLLGAVTTNFEMRRSLAIFPLIIYLLYLIYCVMSEFEIIHPYGSDHRMDQKAEPADF